LTGGGILDYFFIITVKGGEKMGMHDKPLSLI